MSAGRELKGAGHSQILSRWLWTGIDLIFPPSCAGCGKPSIRWCCDCESKIIAINGPTCYICGLPRTKPGFCQRCSVNRPAFAKLRSWAVYSDPIRKALLRLKYSNDVGLGEIFASKLLDLFPGLGWNVDLVVPVPLGRFRQRQRGYNQSDLIARIFAASIGILYDPKVLSRNRETRSQVELELDEREVNVKGAFTAMSDRIRDKKILVIDDIATTGATLSACSEALLAAGAAEILAITVARAL